MSLFFPSLSLRLYLPLAFTGVTHCERCTVSAALTFCHVRPTSVTCSPLSSPAMVPYVCQNVYVVCSFRPDLFPCLPSNEPGFSLGGSEPKASRYLYRRNSWGPPSQSGQGWLEKLSQKLQVKPSVGNFSLFSPSLSLSSFYLASLPRVISLPLLAVQQWPGQAAFTLGQLDCCALTTFFFSPPLPHFILTLCN